MRALKLKLLSLLRAMLLGAVVLISSIRGSAETVFLKHAIVHTVSGEVFTNGGVLIDGSKIEVVWDGKSPLKLSASKTIDLQGQHLYPGLIEVDSVLGLSEIDAVRATQDTTEVGEFTPDVQSWIAVNPDSELLPVARANGIAYFEPVPVGDTVSGQSALLAMGGWTWEQMVLKKPVALHAFWPSMELNTLPKERSSEPSKWKSLEDQAKERRAKLRATTDFFQEAAAYAKAKDAAAKGHVVELEKIPAWEAMLPWAHGNLPLVIHADEARQIKSAIEWAATNHFNVILAGGRDAWMFAELLATNKIPVIYEHIFTQPVHDTEPYDVHFTAPEKLHQAGVKVVFSGGPSGFSAAMARNLPYQTAQAIAFGLPEDEALKGITLYPAQLMGVSDRLGSIEAGKEATLFVCDGNIFDIRANVKQMWIAGREINLESRHTRLYQKYKNRPKP